MHHLQGSSVPGPAEELGNGHRSRTHVIVRAIEFWLRRVDLHNTIVTVPGRPPHVGDRVNRAK